MFCGGGGLNFSLLPISLRELLVAQVGAEFKTIILFIINSLVTWSLAKIQSLLVFSSFTVLCRVYMTRGPHTILSTPVPREPGPKGDNHAPLWAWSWVGPCQPVFKAALRVYYFPSVDKKQ